MEIRFAEAKDVTGILSLLRQVGRVHHDSCPALFRAGAQKYGASQVLAMLNSSKTPVFVAVEEDQVVGYCFCQVKVYEHDPVIKDHTDITLTICAWTKITADKALARPYTRLFAVTETCARQTGSP